MPKEEMYCPHGSPEHPLRLEDCGVCNGSAVAWAQRAARARQEERREMREHGLLVMLVVPADWSADMVERELASCITFGHPRVQTIYDVPARQKAAPPETTVSVRPDAGL